jgi:putative transposase
VRKPAALRRPLELGQCTSLAFGRTLRESGLVASMGSRGDAFDNAACESCISTLKVEWIKRHRYRSRDEARLSEHERRCQERLQQAGSIQ